MDEQKRATLNLGRILGNALAEVQKPGIVAECWTCADGAAYGRRIPGDGLPRYATILHSLESIAAHRAAEHDVRELKP